MPISVVMPALEMAQETGKLIAWLKKEGQPVSKGEPLLEIETDKAIMEIESPGDGILRGIKAQEGAEIPVGQTIAWILHPGETLPLETTHTESGRRHDAASTSTLASPTPAAPSSETSPLKLSPKARRLAKEHGVDLSRIHGSGPGGEVLASDVLAASETKAPLSPNALTKSATSVGSLSPVARLMAERTVHSWTTVPHFFVTREVEATALNEARAKAAADTEKSRGFRTSHTDLLVALVARSLAQHPLLNASWIDGAIRTNPEINIGLAISVDDGVVAPVIANANKLSIADIATLRKELGEKARANKLRPADLTGGTFTISNLGMFNVDAFSAIIIPPQAAILAVGRIADRVVASNGQPAVRPMLSLTLSADHRVVDGARAARFLETLVDAIQNPDKYLT